MRWVVPNELSSEEQAIAKKLRRVGKFFVFLREVRSRLFDEEFESELMGAYEPRGQDPVPPGLLAMVMLLQAYTQTGDAEAVICAQMDRRWQLVLGSLGREGAPFGQGTLFRFRQRMIEHDLDQRLIERTVAFAKETGAFGWQRLKAALDSSPLWGAGRVEDTWNLIGRAISRLVDAVSRVLQVPAGEIVEQLGLKSVASSSVKAALDIDWNDPDERHEALQQLLEEAESLRCWVESRVTADTRAQPPVSVALDDLERVTTQDLEPDPEGNGKRIRRGVARDRVPSLGDREMRHGRKSKEKPFTGYKRHILRMVDERLILAAVAFPANRPEHDAAAPLLTAASDQGELGTLLIDRGYLSSPAVERLAANDVDVRCRPWPLRNRGLFTKDDFRIDLDQGAVTCPADVTAPIPTGSRTARFPKSTCLACDLREQCTRAKKQGRSISVHPQERLLLRLREQSSTPDGRAILRERVDVEHGLARIGAIQGRRARYKGQRKNTLDLRRTAAVVNLVEIRNRLEKLAA